MSILKVGDSFHHKIYGAYEIVEYTSCSNVSIKFNDTGYIQKSKTAANVRGGAVRDKLKPTVCGVGYLGEGKFKTWEKGVHTKMYKVWHNMLVSCYDKNFQENNPSYKGCSVDKDWWDFQKFGAWFECNYFEGGNLSKNMITGDSKLYSSETCSFVSKKDNTVKARAKHYKFINPDGDLVEIYNLNKFCKDNNLNQGHLCSVSTGKRLQYKGWTKYAEIGGGI